MGKALAHHIDRIPLALVKFKVSLLSMAEKMGEEGFTPLILYSY